MPTLYDNFSQIRQYIDENAGQADLSAYVTKTELANASYVTANDISGKADKIELNSYLNVSNFVKPEGVNNLQLLESGLIINNQGKIYTNWYSYNQVVTGGNYNWVGTGTLKNYVNGRLADIESTYATKSDLNGYLHLTGGTMTGQLTLNNGVKLQVGSDRPWEIYEGGTGGNASLTIRNTVDGKHFYIKDVNYNNIVDIHNNLTGTGFVKFSYAANTYTNNIIPNKTNTYTLGDADHIYSASYITDMWLNGTNKFSNRNNVQINLMLNNAWKYVFHTNNFSPANDNAINLGESSVRWGSTYTSNIYTNTAYLKDTSYSSSIVPKENNTYTLGDADHIYSASYTKSTYFTNDSKIVGSNSNINFYTGGLSRITINNNILRPDRTGVNLGSSSNNWTYTYTQNLILGNSNIKDLINGMFSYDSTTGTLTITTLS